MKTADEILKGKPSAAKVCVGPGQTVVQAIEKMNQANVGAILIEEGNDIIGIWTERDLLRAMSRPGFDIHSAIIGDHMKTKLYCAAHDTPLLQLEEMFLGLFIRHIVIKKEDRFIGLLSIGDVLRASLLDKAAELKRLNKIASWQYYENWGWDRKRKNDEAK